VELVPDFKGAVRVDNDVWFELTRSAVGPTATFVAPDAGRGSAVRAAKPITFALKAYEHDITHLHRFVEAAQARHEQEKLNNLGTQTFFFDMVTGGGAAKPALPAGFVVYAKHTFTTNRTLHNVFFEQAAALRERVEFFQSRREWYDRKGVPWTLGVTMWGTPGCGKVRRPRGPRSAPANRRPATPPRARRRPPSRRSPTS
jgi:hypothetical protein